VGWDEMLAKPCPPYVMVDGLFGRLEVETPLAAALIPKLGTSKYGLPLHGKSV